jgi:hypothetical protein
MRQIKCNDGTIKTVADDYTLQHGESLFTPMFMMDHGIGTGDDLDLHRPGFRFADDAQARAVDQAFADYLARTCSAWRDPVEDEGKDATPPTRRRHADAAAALDAAYSDYINRTTNAWRSR